MKTQRVLVVLPATPYPARAQGLSLRYYPILKYLKSQWHVDLIVLDEIEMSQEFADNIVELCDRYLTASPYAEDQPGLVSKLSLGVHSLLPNTAPYDSVRHGDSSFKDQLHQFVDGHTYDSFLWVGIESNAWINNQYYSVFEDIKNRITYKKLVVDFVDSPSLHSMRFSDYESRVEEALSGYDTWKTKNRETSFRKLSDEAIYISKTDAETVLPIDKKTHIVPNGVLIEGYHEYKHSDIEGPTIGFLGDMSYEPNVQAACWICNHVFDKARQAIDGLQFYIIGRNPSEEIQELGKRDGVVVTGRVEDIWEYVNAMDVFMLPLFSGAGQQNKILETMYAGKPVITTTIGNEGIEATHQKELIVANSVEEIHQFLLKLFDDSQMREDLGRSARDFIQTQYSWENITRQFESILIGK